MKKTAHHKLYSINDVAEKLGISPVTLRLWEKQGYISPARTPGNQRRYSQEDIFHIKNQIIGVSDRKIRAQSAIEIPNLYHSLPLPQKAVFRSFAFLSLISFVVFVFVKFDIFCSICIC